MSELNILHVIPSFDPRDGGTYTVLKGLACAQATIGHNVSIYTTKRYKSDGKESCNERRLENEDGVRLYRAAAYTPLLFSTGFARMLKRGLEHADIVHVHGLYRFPVTYAAWMARKKGAPCIMMTHGALDHCMYSQSGFGKLGLPIKRVYERLFDLPNLHQASAIQYTATREKEDADFLKLRAPAFIMPNGIDWRRYEVLPKAGGFRKRFGFDSKTPLVLFLGRINFKKGLDLLIPSFSRVVEKIPDARLAVVGPDGDGYSSLVRQWCREKRILDKVVFEDYLDPEEVKKAFVDADVFVLPSYAENFGMAVVEAMACGCPVVISDQVKICSEVQEAGAGIVTNLAPGNISDAISLLLEDRGRAKEMGGRGRLAAGKRFAWPRIINEMTHVYRILIEKNHVTFNCQSK